MTPGEWHETAWCLDSWHEDVWTDYGSPAPLSAGKRRRFPFILWEKRGK